MFHPVIFMYVNFYWGIFSNRSGKISTNLKNASVKEFFKAIEKQTNYRFSYRDAEVNGKRGVTILTNGKALKQVLVEELAKQGLDYTVSGNKIINISCKEDRCLY